MSGDWQRLHQVRGVCGGSPENHRVTRLSHKAEAEDRACLSTTRNVAIYDDLLVTPLTIVIEWYVICDEISIFVIGGK
jgi:hypothetical protein